MLSGAGMEMEDLAREVCSFVAYSSVALVAGAKTCNSVSETRRNVSEGRTESCASGATACCCVTV